MRWTFGLCSFYRASHLSLWLGADVERTETYLTYVEGVPQTATTPEAKSVSGVAGSASRQADAVRAR